LVLSDNSRTAENLIKMKKKLVEINFGNKGYCQDKQYLGEDLRDRMNAFINKNVKPYLEDVVSKSDLGQDTKYLELSKKFEESGKDKEFNIHWDELQEYLDNLKKKKMSEN